MKKILVLLLVLLMTLTFPHSFACAEESGTRDILLLTYHQLTGWSDTFRLSALDSEGNLWDYLGTRKGIPYEHEELLAWAETTEELTLLAILSDEPLEQIKSLVQTVTAQEVYYQSAAYDAGLQVTFSARKDENGLPELIVLGAFGDLFYENTDLSAQSLYITFLTLLSEVDSLNDPFSSFLSGFQETDLLTFCGYEGLDLTQYVMTVYSRDCEAGLTKVEPAMSAQDLMNMTVTAKKNSLFVTGNTILYCFEDSAGETIAVFEFFDHLLVRPDGMYSLRF